MSFPFVVVVLSISIHALVKRATGRVSDSLEDLHISIHALVKRATKVDKNVLDYFAISIHALVKRATLSSYWQFLLPIFQSTPS